ncbi:MAG: hypothetical protein RBR66_02460 [Candidatus Izemoplasmatales bacterium]|nr:hypothetical protein [Candidatus Izemoplasmatales bacterium]
MSKFKTKEEFFDFSKLLLVVPIRDLVNLMIKYEIKLPLYVHRFLLKETIREKAFNEILYQTYTDEQKFRLRGFDNFSIFLLEKMMNDYNLEFSLPRYKEMLLNLIYLNKEALVIRNNFFNELEGLQTDKLVDIEVMKYEDFFPIINKVLYEQNGFLDGISINEWDDELLTSYTLGDLKALGLKYDVKIPRRINKAKLIEILAAKFKLSPDEQDLLETKSVLELEIYAKEKGFKISIDLKKTDMIEYMIYSLGMYDHYPKDDFFDYHIPLETDGEVIEDDLIEEQEVVEEEYIPEETHDEVIEELPVTPVLDEVEEENEVPLEEEILEPQEEFVEPKKEKVDKEEVSIPDDLKVEPSLADSELLSPEEKELLDEKINLIIKKYYKRRRTRTIIWIVVIILVVAALGWAGYTYLWPLING